jgi:hypothetical protein
LEVRVVFGLQLDVLKVEMHVEMMLDSDSE